MNTTEVIIKMQIVSENIQIIGMSATLNNIEDLQRFLHAEIYTSDFRPVSYIAFRVPIWEGLKYRGPLLIIKPKWC